MRPDKETTSWPQPELLIHRVTASKMVTIWDIKFDPWVGKIPLKKKWQPAPVFLSRESHGQRSLGGYSPWGGQELDMTEHTHAHTQTHTQDWNTAVHAWHNRKRISSLRVGKGVSQELMEGKIWSVFNHFLLWSWNQRFVSSSYRFLLPEWTRKLLWPIFLVKQTVSGKTLLEFPNSS